MAAARAGAPVAGLVWVLTTGAPNRRGIRRGLAGGGLGAGLGVTSRATAARASRDRHA